MEQSFADRYDGEELIDTKLWRCAFYGQLTTTLQNMPLVYDMGTKPSDYAVNFYIFKRIDAHSWNKV